MGGVADNVSKGAVAQLTRCCAMDFTDERVRVNAVGPGTIDTPGAYGHMRAIGEEALGVRTVGAMQLLPGSGLTGGGAAVTCSLYDRLLLLLPTPASPVPPVTASTVAVAAACQTAQPRRLCERQKVLWDFCQLLQDA